MDTNLIQRYQPGGDIYDSFVRLYNVDAANTIATAALTGSRTQITEAINRVKFGQPLNDSTASIFIRQIENNPLQAPLESLDGQIRAALGDLFTNPMSLLLLAGIAWGAWQLFGTHKFLKGK